MCYQLTDIESSAEKEIKAAIKVPTDSPWLDGHFPGKPVLPGLAQIYMVYDVIQQAYKRKLRVSSVSRVRFKRIVGPDDLLTVRVVPMEREADTFSFRIQIRDTLVCSGVMRLKAQA